MGRQLAAEIEFLDGPRVVISLDELSAMPPAQLAGAVIRLVTHCPVCGAWTADVDVDDQGGAQGGEIDG